jgi:flavin reductase (DIM6/NTAB) family NADH-FMN oxidoreductase RutF
MVLPVDYPEVPADLPEDLRRVMRNWTTGVTVVSSIYDGVAHGMTVNSFTSISLTPPLISVTMANNTRTLQMVKNSKIFGISILGESQVEISDIFAGKIHEDGNRFEGIETFVLKNDAPLIANSIAYLNCLVAYAHPLQSSTLILGEVTAAALGNVEPPLVYLNRSYHSLKNKLT